MPKLPKLSNTSFLSIVILIAVIGVLAFLFLSNSSILKNPNENAHTKTQRGFATINGKVTEIDVNNQTLRITVDFEEKTYKAKLETGGKVIINDKESSFSDIQVEDAATVYSSDKEINSFRTSKASIISVTRVTQDILDKLNGKN